MVAQKTWVNGLPTLAVPADDRGLAFGDGLFETILLNKAKPSLLNFHLERLQEGALALKIPIVLNQVKQEIHAFSQSVGSQYGVIKLIVTRGSGPRGYAATDHTSPTRILLFYPSQPPLAFTQRPGVIATVSSVQLMQQQSLAGIKHLNRLEQVLAAMTVTPVGGATDSIVLDQHQNVIETVSSNVFVVNANQVRTPDLSNCGVNGCIRRLLLARMRDDLDVDLVVTKLKLSDLKTADCIFITNSLKGVQRIKRIGLWSYEAEDVTVDCTDTMPKVNAKAQAEMILRKIAAWVDDTINPTQN